MSSVPDSSGYAAEKIHWTAQESIRRAMRQQANFWSVSAIQKEDITAGNLNGISRKIRDYKKMAEELEIGEPTLRDITAELEKPGRDPRDEMPKPILRSDVLAMEDLKEGMVLKGTVRNVIDFGAFVDIGVHRTA